MDYQEGGIGSKKINIPVELAKASNLDHDTPLFIEDAQHESIDATVQPTGLIPGDGPGPFEFVIPSQDDSYLMMNNIVLTAKMRIVRENGGNLTAADDVAPINCIGTTLWEHVETLVNDQVINPASAANTHYRGYLENILSYDISSQNTHLACQMFAIDDAGHYDDNAANDGYKVRKAVAESSRIFDVATPIVSDFLRANNHLAPGNKLTLRLYRARDSFVLLTGGQNKYKLRILDLKLHYKRIRLRENIPPPRIERYLITRCELKRYNLAAGMRNFDTIIHSGGKMPKSVIIAMVNTAAAEGDYSLNPLNFRHFDIGKIGLRVNGRSVPSEPLQPNFSADTPLVSKEYLHLFANTGNNRMDRGNCITKQQFLGGATVFAFDLNQDACNGYHLHRSSSGVIQLEMAWRTELPQGINILVDVSFDELISKRHGQAIFEFETI